MLTRTAAVAPVLFATVLLASPTASATRPAHDYRVVFPFRIGAFSIDHHHYATYRQAVRAFGKPSYRRPRSAVICSVTWRRAGLRLQFRSASKPCSRAGISTAHWVGATILSRRWSVDRGVRVRDTVARITRLYPKLAPPFHGRWELAFRYVTKPHTTSPAFITLYVTTRDGRIRKFQIDYEG